MIFSTHLGDIVHYFIVLIRNRGQVIPLQMLSTVDGIQVCNLQSYDDQLT